MPLAIAVAISGVVRYSTTEFILTNKRIIASQGLLRRHSLELFLPQVESIRIDQPFFGQVLQYGTVVVAGSGGTKERFSVIAKPYELRRRVNLQLSGMAQGK